MEGAGGEGRASSTAVLPRWEWSRVRAVQVQRRVLRRRLAPLLRLWSYDRPEPAVFRERLAPNRGVLFLLRLSTAPLPPREQAVV